MPEMKETKVLLAMSGGVDSSAAGKLLRDAGYDCVGCTMKLYENEDAGLSRSRTCCSLEDVEALRTLGKGRLDVTIGSALDLFGGCIPYRNVVYLR